MKVFIYLFIIFSFSNVMANTRGIGSSGSESGGRNMHGGEGGEGGKITSGGGSGGGKLILGGEGSGERGKSGGEGGDD